MSLPLKGLPPEIASLDPASGSVSLTLDESLYPLEAVYGASYIFIDRAFVLLDRTAPSRLRATIAAKTGTSDEETLRGLAGEFANELLSCAWRAQITTQNRAILEAVTMQAIAGAMGPPSLEDLEKFDFTEEPFDDPLGIAVSWEEKYKKKSKDEASGAAASPADAAAPSAEAAPKADAP